MNHTRLSSPGITLIDTVVGTALMLVVFVGIATAFKLSIDVVTNNKARAGAIALGNERLEYIRSLTYASVGTAGGIPAGLIPQSETVVSNGVTYTRRTLVQYDDDPQDGLGAADTNHITLDYKTVKVDMTWQSRTGTRHLAFVTRITPPSGVESPCAACGTLSVTVVNAASQLVTNAAVRLVNSTTNPVIDITTYTDNNGVADFIGAPSASNYQVFVSKVGYNSDQTYNPSAQNTNPVPGPLTVSNNLTTSATFRIDVLATKNIYTYTTILSGTWTDSLSDTSKISTSTAIDVSAGSATLSGPSGSYPPYGEFQSIAIGPSSLTQWKTLTLTHSKPAGTDITYHLYDGSGSALIPDAQLPGNSTGIATSSASVDLSNVSTTTYPALRLDATFSSGDSAATPSIDSYTIVYTYGPNPLPNIPFTMRGAKTIGSGPPIVYKYEANLNSGSTASVILQNFEWDNYTITVPSSSGYDIASSCNPQPEFLTPGSNVSTYLYLAAHTTNSLLVDVSSASVYISNAQVSIWKSGTATTTLSSDRCGQVFFPSLSAATYSIQISATGHPTLNQSVDVLGTTRSSVTLN